MATIIVSFGVPSDGFKALYDQKHTVHIPPTGVRFSREEMLALLPEADAVLACTPFPREMVEAGKKLKLIVCYGAGYDSIDIAAATEHGIPVVNIPETVTAATAELAIAHMMSMARRIRELDELVRTMAPSELFVMGRRMGTRLEGATLGIVGMGRIGGKVADFGRVMGMRVLYTARTPKPERDALGDEHVDLETLMRESDFISLHCPHTPETHGMISREMIALMKPSAFLVNTARGPVLDEEALIEALREKKIAGAALDVYIGEPNVNPAFFELENVQLTPHSGSNTLATRNQMAEAASAQILAVLNDQPLQNVINPEVL
ncbi:MAG: dihydrofolate reductase [Clostridiales bacterium]|nr:dihydrofolate reductase [Clostridiales bacterium]